MNYRLADVPALLGTSPGRMRLKLGGCRLAWKVLARPAAWYRRRVIRNTRIVGVTGSFGKTTTTRATLAALGRDPGSVLHGNAGCFLARALFRIRPGQRHAVIEIGISRPDQMSQYAQVVSPDIAVVTAVGSEHNRSLGTLERTRHEKAHLVRGLPASGTAVLNGDDPNVRWMAGETRARVVTFGFGDTNDVRAGTPQLDWPRGMCFRVMTREGAREMRVRLVGRPMVYPLLAAVAVALELGVPLDRALAALETVPPTPGRLQPVVLPNGAVILRDDFKGPQETIEAALDLLGEIPAGRRIVVLGEVSEPIGSQGPIYRQLGSRVAQVAARAVFVAGSNTSAYSTGARRGGLARGAIVDAKGSPARAVQALKADLRPGDVILIKGRDTQHLARVALALMGRQVRCELPVCDSKLECHDCRMLERGWQGRRILT